MMRLARVTALALFAVAGGAIAADGEPAPLRLARYTTAAALPDPALTAPLAVVAQVSFPRDTVATVGDALAFLLLRTGYRLGDADAAASALLALPLPEAHRQLGPYPVRAIAAVLVGSAYELQVSEVDRRLNVLLATPDQDAPAAAAETTDASPLLLAQPRPDAGPTQAPLAEAPPPDLAPQTEPAADTRQAPPAATAVDPFSEELR